MPKQVQRKVCGGGGVVGNFGSGNFGSGGNFGVVDVEIGGIVGRSDGGGALRNGGGDGGEGSSKEKITKSSNKMCASVPDYPLYEGDYDYGGGGGVPVDSSAVIF